MKKKGLAVLVLISLLMVGVAYAKEYEIAKKAGEYNVAMKIDRNPPIVGDNNVSIEITDASGHHATDAKVTVEYSMPAMPGMPPMNYKSNAALKGDAYNAKMNLSIVGKTSTAKFTVDAK
jgi:hypothetical protein